MLPRAASVCNRLVIGSGALAAGRSITLRPMVNRSEDIDLGLSDTATSGRVRRPPLFAVRGLWPLAALPQAWRGWFV